METKDPASIQYATYNPRTLSEHDGKSLVTSMTKFGDISGITVNVRTNTYVTGHMRMQTLDNKFPGRLKIQVEARHEPDQYGTVATGAVIVEGESLSFAYREVDWPVEMEKAANIAANRIEADWNQEMLAELNHEISQLENGPDLLAATGQSSKELEKLEKLAGIGDNEEPDEMGPDPKESDRREIRATAEQWEVIDEALENIKATREIPAEENGSRNGSALYYLAREHLDRVQGLTDAPAAPATPAGSEPVDAPPAA